MIGALADIVERTKIAVSDLDFVLIEDGHWRATFARQDGWSIVLDADQVSYPAFTLVIVSTTPKFEVGVWILMRLFQDGWAEDRKIPSLQNQLWFLKEYEKSIFFGWRDWKTQYDELNANGEWGDSGELGTP